MSDARYLALVRLPVYVVVLRGATRAGTACGEGFTPVWAWER